MKDIIYIPILKWKNGEQSALKELDEGSKRKIMPLVELVKKKKSLKQENNKTVYIPREDLEVLRTDLAVVREKFSDLRILLDTKMLTDISRSDAMLEVCSKTNLFENNIVPVLYISDSETDFYTEVLEYLKESGLCLRISVDELEKLSSYPFAFSSRDKTDLLIDMGITEDKSEKIIELLKNELVIEGWRSIALASGAFPRNVNKFTPEEVGRQKRSDWLLWNKVAKAVGDLVINYGDYATRFPLYEDINTPNTSFSFRYTGNDVWYVFRGFSRIAKKSPKPPDIQYRAHAVTITGSQEFEFSGETFSKGDSYIKSKANLVDEVTNKIITKHCGSSTTWLQAGVNHHICKVLEQLSSTFDSSDN